jgi:hypothetical protein
LATPFFIAALALTAGLATGRFFAAAFNGWDLTGVFAATFPLLALAWDVLRPGAALLAVGLVFFELGECAI